MIIAGEPPATSTSLRRRRRPGQHLQQPDRGQPGQRRRRRPALPDGGQLPVQRLQQHDREQHLHARRRRRGDRQRAQRALLQQHGHEEPDHGHRGDQQRPARAGRPVDRASNNDFLQATLPAGSPLYSNPLMFNNIFWDNRAGTWDGAQRRRHRRPGLVERRAGPDPTPINHWDMGVPGTSFQLAPTNSILQTRDDQPQRCRRQPDQQGAIRTR